MWCTCGFHVWCTCSAQLSEEFKKNTCRICSVQVHEVYMFCKKMYIWCTCGAQLVYNWCTIGVHLVYMWSTCGLHAVYMRFSCGVHVGLHTVYMAG